MVWRKARTVLSEAAREMDALWAIPRACLRVGATETATL
jgi:hypothetical protein